MGKKVFTNIVCMLTTGVSCALGAAVYSFNVSPCVELDILKYEEHFYSLAYISTYQELNMDLSLDWLVIYLQYELANFFSPLALETSIL